MAVSTVVCRDLSREQVAEALRQAVGLMRTGVGSALVTT
jgi:hypothetical protein